MAKNKECNLFRTSIGGQALIEGIMMRGIDKEAIVIRTPEGFIRKEQELKLIKDKYPILGWPIIRGAVNFVDSMVKGVKALTFSAECMPEEEIEQPSKFDLWVERRLGSEKAEKVLLSTAVGLGIVLSIVLFIFLPTILAGFLDSLVTTAVTRNLTEGAIRILIFLAYMYFATKVKDIKRIWQYHGAEHKTIHCYEKGLDLTVENIRGQSRFHPRCGTSFLLIIMIVSILVFSFVSWTNPFVRMAMRLLLLPLVVGLSYELIKFAGRHDNWFTRILSAPGKALQRLTTDEPDDSMIEVAVEALQMVLPKEKGADKW